ncbi:TPA: NAD-dependent epimerase/dehydratase family protein, partial [Pseudomonas aeruginosa]|nr:NAD-dependent epimerase/dehydratase family protein [Pseudomonas aeruginosa]
DPLAEFRKVNVEGTLNLARQAAAAGVKRFVFVSSIKVNGESTTADSPFKPDDVPAPSDPYGISKLEAEIGLRQVCEEAGMEYAIVRPVLVYGPGVKANFLNMMKWLDKGIPLPLGAIKNRRSLVSLTNLMDMLITVASHPAAANQVFLVSDGEDLSTTGLLRRMAAAMGKRANLLPVPESLLKTAALLLGKKSVGQRLCGSLQVDISKNKQLLDWNPPLSVDQGLQRVAEYYLEYR